MSGWVLSVRVRAIFATFATRWSRSDIDRQVELLIRARRIRPHIAYQAATTNSETHKGIFQGDNRRDSEKTQSRDGAISHVPADFQKNVGPAFDQFPNQQDIGHVDKEKHR